MSLELTPAQREALTSDEITVGIRPEDLSPTNEGTGLPITAEVVEELGADAYVYGQLAPVTAANTVVRVDPSAQSTKDSGRAEEGLEEGASPVVVRTDGRTPPRPGSTVWVAPNQERIHLFDAATGNRLPE
ncbi:hypothetical protein GCM10009824_20080 [Kocuria atrinae]|uniref:Sugar ABC transporter ATP-binding protein n=2 Tax=Kocuria atrinae TaxID=592377 RepID=A0ABN2XXS4_9MICC